MKGNYFNEWEKYATEHRPGGITQNIYSDDSIHNNEVSAEEVREYLLTVVSGTLFPYGTEHGEMYVSFEKLKELVCEGYNIVRVLNPENLSAYNIYIEYQKYVDDKIRGRK